MTEIKLRAHHLLCMRFFEGRGYSEAFVQNMAQVLKAERCVITDGADDICAACPHLQNGLCETQEKVQRYDRQVRSLLQIETGKGYDLHTLSAGLRLDTAKLRDICGDCVWQTLCQSKLSAE
ncbi:MAG: DUF1284 domain-containing protein [Acutalibacteraceae bacterium]